MVGSWTPGSKAHSAVGGSIEDLLASLSAILPDQSMHEDYLTNLTYNNRVQMLLPWLQKP